MMLSSSSSCAGWAGGTAPCAGIVGAPGAPNPLQLTRRRGPDPDPTSTRGQFGLLCPPSERSRGCRGAAGSRCASCRFQNTPGSAEHAKRSIKL